MGADVHRARPGEKFLRPTHQGGAQARPNHCPRGGGRPYQYRSPNARADLYPGVPHSLVEGSLFLPQHRKTPSYPSCPVSSVPPPPSRLVRSRVAGHAAGGARPAPSPGGVSRSLCPRPLERSCGWDDAGLESHNLTPPNRGCNLYPGAAGAAGE